MAALFPSKPLLLVFPFGYLSHYLRCIALCRHFAPFYDIQFAHHPRYASFVRTEGFSTFPYQGMDEHGVLEGAKNFDFSWMSKEGLTRAYREQVSIMERMRPQAVLGDAQPSLRMAAEKTQTLFIALLNGYMSKHFAGRRTLSRTHPLYGPVKALPELLGNAITSFGESIAMRQVHRPFARIRRAEGLKGKSSFLDELEGDLNLICDLPELFPQKTLPPDYHVIGPLIYDGTVPSRGLANQLYPGKKTLLLTMGSTGNWPSLQWLAGNDFLDYNIITTGDREGIIHGPNVFSVPFAAAAEVMPLADLVICQGGNGGIYQALSYGLPLLCITAHFEQEWNVAALEKKGLGRSLNGVPSLKKRRLLVDGWSARKGAAPFQQIAQSIRRSTAQLPENIASLCSTAIIH